MSADDGRRLRISDRSRTFTITGATLRAWMRGADLKAPRWKNGTLILNRPPPWHKQWPKINGEDYARFNVSRASVERARRRWRQKVSYARPAEPAPTRQPPAAEADCFVYNGNIAAPLRRVYTDAEKQAARPFETLAGQAPDQNGQTALSIWQDAMSVCGHTSAPWRDMPDVSSLTHQDVGVAFATMLAADDQIDGAYKRGGIKNNLIYRAFEAACRFGLASYNKRNVRPAALRCADIVIETVRREFPENDTRSLPLLAGLTSCEAASITGRPPSTLRDWLRWDLRKLRHRLGKYCRGTSNLAGLWWLRQKSKTPCYNINIWLEGSASERLIKPRRTKRQAELSAPFNLTRPQLSDLPPISQMAQSS